MAAALFSAADGGFAVEGVSEKSSTVPDLVGLAAVALSIYVRVFLLGRKNLLPISSKDFAMDVGWNSLWTENPSGIFIFSDEDDGTPCADSGMPARTSACVVTSTSLELAVEWYGISTDVDIGSQGSSADDVPRLFSIFMTRSGS